MDRLIETLDGGVLIFSTGHAQVKANLLTAARSYPLQAKTAPLPDEEVELLPEGVDFAIVTRCWIARFKEIAAAWRLPVGTSEFPPQTWYAASVHDPSGVLNDGYKHTGVDLNLDRAPWGDVDRGQPVFAIADGVIHAVGYTNDYLGSIVLQVEHNGQPLYARYWHLEKDAAFSARAAGQRVATGDILGRLGNYKGGDHLHFDTALDPFVAGAWLTAGVRWIDPVPILKAHVDPALVDAMMHRGDA